MDYWLPMNLGRQMNSSRFFMLTARLKPGVTIAQAQSEMNGLSAQLEKDSPEDDHGWSIRLQPLREFLYGWAGATLLTLEAAVVLLLLIACANVAGPSRRIQVSQLLGSAPAPSCFEMFSLVIVPPHTPHRMLEVIGIPLVNVPAFELDCTWRTMMRLTGATRARR